MAPSWDTTLLNNYYKTCHSSPKFVEKLNTVYSVHSVMLLKRNTSDTPEVAGTVVTESFYGIILLRCLSLDKIGYNSANRKTRIENAITRRMKDVTFPTSSIMFPYRTSGFRGAFPLSRSNWNLAVDELPATVSLDPDCPVDPWRWPLVTCATTLSLLRGDKMPTQTNIWRAV